MSIKVKKLKSLIRPVLKFIACLFATLFFINNYCQDNSVNTKIAAKSPFWKNHTEGIYSSCVPLSKGSDDEYIYFFKINPSIYKAKIIYSSELGCKTLTVKEIAEKTKASAVVNASYFDEKNEVLGFLKVNGKVYNDYIAEPIIYSGITAINNGKLSILHRNDFAQNKYNEAAQAGPRLISKGKQTEGVANTIDFRKKSRRAGIAIDSNGNILIFKTYRSIANWEQIISTIRNNPELKIVEAMNLDGGSSTQITVNTKSFKFSDGHAQIPVAIGFFKKT